MGEAGTGCVLENSHHLLPCKKYNRELRGEGGANLNVQALLISVLKASWCPRGGGCKCECAGTSDQWRAS